MTSMIIRTLTVIFVLCAARSSALAQAVPCERLRIVDSTTVQTVEMRDGSRLVGRTTALSDSTFVFQVGQNLLTLACANIVAVEELAAPAAGRGAPWFVHPHQTNLVLGPTGRTLSRGQGFFSLQELFFPTLNYGLTNHLTIGAGLTLLPGVGLDDQIVYVLPKVAVVRTPAVNVALGGVVLRAGDIFDISERGSATFGVVYGAGTIGGPDANATAGLGFGFAGDQISSQPLIQLGGQARLGSGIAVITENWVIGRSDEDSYWLSWTGLRFLHRKATVDATVLFSPQDSFWLPWLVVTLGF